MQRVTTEGIIGREGQRVSLGKVKTHYESGITRFDEDRRRPAVRIVAACLAILVLLWAALPVARTGLLLWTSPFRQAPSKPSGLPIQAVHFRASDGVSLRGWLVRASARAPVVILVPGFKADRSSMVPYARFLHAAGYTVLLYDSRGTGASGGTFSLGVREVRDVVGAVDYLQRQSDLRDHRYGLLGVSLGAGEAIVAAAKLRAVGATVADSAPEDERRAVQRLDTLSLGSLSLPLAPLATWTAGRILGAPYTSFSPLRAVSHIAPRALLLIHSRHDANPTTPLSGARALYRHAGRNAFLWIAPRGGHAGALAAQPARYKARVIAFLRRYLR